MKSIKKRLKLRKVEDYAMEKLAKLDNFIGKPVKLKSNKMKVSRPSLRFLIVCFNAV